MPIKTETINAPRKAGIKDFFVSSVQGFGTFTATNIPKKMIKQIIVYIK